MTSQNRPVLIYDSDCNFCSHWIARWRHVTGDRVDYLPSQEVAHQFPDIAPEKFEASVQLVQRDGTVYEGAEAVFRTLAFNPNHGWPLWMYRRIPAVALVTEFLYRFVARHRTGFGRLTGWLLGDHLELSTWYTTRKVFLSLLGVIYFFAFTSLWVQIEGLVGSRGIMPVNEFLNGVKEITGTERYWVLPTVFWFNASDEFLNLICLAGTGLSLCLVGRIFVVPALILLWFFYLSLMTASQEFMSFEWDALLLEAGFLAIFLAPSGGRHLAESPPSPLVLFLYRFLLFRLIFLSGMAKLASGDPTWRDGTALKFHFETQPLPTWGGWYAHQLPSWLQEFSVGGLFVTQLVVPFFIFAPRRLRHTACAVLAGFQLLIIITGNYAFFNFLTLALCLLLLDDAFWKKWLPERMVCTQPQEHLKRAPVNKSKQWAVGTLTATVIFVSVTQDLIPLVFKGHEVPSLSKTIHNWFRPLHIVNSYGLFAVMTTKRPEIVIEGSMDGETWKAYEFKWKPGELKRAPEFVAPHQPRLDWQMWFAALGGYRQNRWVMQFMTRLLEGAEPVLHLLKSNPFPNKPPGQIRAVVYEYKFTDFSDWRADGSWWRRELKGLYVPVIKLPESA